MWAFGGGKLDANIPGFSNGLSLYIKYGSYYKS